jgi:predicted Fe-Mo cluster-binding NifX family protein
MKICLPTSGKNGLTEMVYYHFGSAPFFTIYDTDTKGIEVIANDNQHHNHGACQPLSVIAKYNVDIIMTNGMGARAVRMLNDSGIKVYRLDGNTVGEAIKKFEDNQLFELRLDNACSEHNCH